MTSSSLQADLNFNGKKELERILKESDIDHDDICLVGSMSLSVRGIREHNDVDVCVNPDYQAQLCSTQFPAGISVAKGRYDPIGISDNELLRDHRYHDVVAGYKIVRPELTLSYKKYRNRPKDVDDIELLEEYRETGDEWDEELYQSLGTGSSTSLISRGIESRRNDGVVVTGIKTAGFLERRYPTISTLHSYLPIKECKVASKRLSRETETMSSAAILTNQYCRGKFSAMDVVLRYDLLSQFSNDQTDDLPSYVAENLVSESDIARLRELQAVESETLSRNPIRINYKYRILNPNDFAAKLWHGLDDHEISIRFQQREARAVDWLSETGASSTTIEQLQQRRLELLEEVGMLFYAILWPPSSEYHDEIERTLSSNIGIGVVDSTDAVIDDMYSFVHAVYSAQADPTSESQIDEKIELMDEYGSEIRVLTLELPDPRIRDEISLEMEAIKNDVRHQIVPKLSDDLYYSVLHVTDNYADNKRTKQAIEKFT